MAVTLVGYSMPIFWWGLLLIILFSGNLGWTPVSGRIDLLYFFEPVTGFMLIDSLLLGRGGRLRLGRLAPHPADDRAGDDPAGGDRPADPLGDAGGAERGLCPHRPRQGPAAAARGRAARAAQRADPGGHHDRPAGRHPAGRRHPDRDDLLLARRRQVAGRFDLPPRLPGGAGRAAADRARRDAGQPDRRPALRPDQPAHPAQG